MDVSKSERILNCNLKQNFELLGKGQDLLAVKIPVVARKRMVFVVHAPDVPALDMPALVDPSGVYCLMEEIGNTFICGKIPSKVSLTLAATNSGVLRKI